MILLAVTSDFHVWSHRVHFGIFLPTLFITLLYHSVPTRPTSIISSRSMTSINAINSLLTYMLVSPHSILTLKDHVLHISRHLVNRYPDVFSTRYKLFLITFEYFRVSCHLFWYRSRYSSNSGSCRYIYYRRNNGKDTFLSSFATVQCTDGIDLSHIEDSTLWRIVNDGFFVYFIILLVFIVWISRLRKEIVFVMTWYDLVHLFLEL